MLVAILSAGTISCSTVTYIPAATQFYAIDFSKYTELGFLITPEKFIGEYESIGIVAVDSYPEYKNSGLERNNQGAIIDVGSWQSAPLPINEVIDKVYDQSKAMGANALMNFKTEAISRSVDIGNSKILTIDGTRVSGFAIKRK